MAKAPWDSDLAQELASLELAGGYCAVRRNDDGKLWLSLASLSCDLETCRKETDRIDRLVPHWAKVNPVVEIIPVDIVPRMSLAERSEAI